MCNGCGNMVCVAMGVMCVVAENMMCRDLDRIGL